MSSDVAAWAVAVVLLLASTPSFAQTNSPDAAPTTAPGDVSKRDESPEPQMRKNTFGIGPGFVFWPPVKGDPEDTVDIAPALALQHRKAVPLVSVLGFEWTNDVVFHDWKAMGDAYNWLFSDSGDTGAAVKLALWPGIFLIPFGAANYTTGFGLIVWTSQQLPSVYFDLGFNFALWLRLSDPDFRADFGIGAYGGMGVDILKNLGANLRVLWGPPLIHNLIRQDTSSITTITLNINFFH